MTTKINFINVLNVIIFMLNNMEKKKEVQKINVYNDNEMRAAGFFRPYDQKVYDWSKSAKEHKLIKKAKRRHKNENMHFGYIPRGRAYVKAKLIIQLKRNNKFEKTTYSFECWNTAINEILGNFQIYNSKTKSSESIIAKYTYNGKTYNSEERPNLSI